MVAAWNILMTEMMQLYVSNLATQWIRRMVQPFISQYLTLPRRLAPGADHGV